MSNKPFGFYFEEYFKPVSLFRIKQKAKIEELEYSLNENKGKEIDNITKNSIGNQLAEFFSSVNNWKQKWKTKGHLDIELEGSINILPIEEVLIGDVDFLPEKYPVMKAFTLLDFFYNEAAVGFYLDQPEKGLFYFEFDANPQKLNLDFKGYLEMLRYTKGAAYWQKSIIEPIIDETSSAVIEKMNTLFPEITVKGFYELYNSLRIDK